MEGNIVNLRQGKYYEKISSRFWEIWHLRYHVLEAFAKMSPDHLICVPCFYGCQADKPARPIGWLGSCVRKYCLLCAGKVLWKNFEPFWRNVTSKIVFSSCSCLYIAMNDCLLLPMFPWTPIVQTSAANWLTRFKWKEILSTLGRESIMKKFRAVFEKYII